MSETTTEESQKYNKLVKIEEYDREAAEQLAAAKNELLAVEAHAHHLRSLIDENQKLSPFVWTDQEGVAKAVHELEDDHLKNILLYIAQRGQEPNKGLKSEARSRGFAIPKIGDAIRKLTARLDVAPGAILSYSRSHHNTIDGEII